MPSTKIKSAGTKTPMTRASVSFPSELYRELEAIARQRKVSVAWVIRDAAEKYVEDRWPRLERSGR